MKENTHENKAGIKVLGLEKPIQEKEKELKEMEELLEGSLYRLKRCVEDLKEKMHNLDYAESENMLIEDEPKEAEKIGAISHTKEEIEKIKEEIEKVESIIEVTKSDVAEHILDKAVLQAKIDELKETEKHVKDILLEIKPERLN